MRRELYFGPLVLRALGGRNGIGRGWWTVLWGRRGVTRMFCGKNGETERKSRLTCRNSPDGVVQGKERIGPIDQVAPVPVIGTDMMDVLADPDIPAALMQKSN